MAKIKEFLKRKDIILSSKRYGIDALGAMAQGLFCTLLVGTILNTIGQQFNIGVLKDVIVSTYTVGGLASAMVGPGIAIAIGFALHCPPLAGCHRFRFCHHRCEGTLRRSGTEYLQSRTGCPCVYDAGLARIHGALCRSGCRRCHRCHSPASHGHARSSGRNPSGYVPRQLPRLYR